MCASIRHPSETPEQYHERTLMYFKKIRDMALPEVKDSWIKFVENLEKAYSNGV